DVTGIGAALTLFDVKQLEVHRGPQPTRFGSSALAGAINIITEKPTESLSGQTLLAVGNDERVSGGGAVSGSLTENLALRLSAFGHRQNGFRDNVFLSSDDTNERQEFTGRAKLLLTPSDDARFTLSYTGVNLNNGYDVFTIFNGFQTQSDKPGRDEEAFHLLSLQGEVDLSSTDQLVFTSSYYNSDTDYSFDGDWGSNSFWAPNDPYDYFSDTNRDRSVYAQQIRLRGSAPIFGEGGRYLVGAFFQNLEEDTQTSEFSDDIIYDFLDSDYQAKTVAGFGNMEVPLGDDFTLISGARLEHRDTDYTDNRGNDFSPSDFLWGGNVTLQYELNDNVTPYLLVSRGFRGGGFNSSPSLSADQLRFADESLTNIELGTRFELMDGTLKGSIASFLNFRRDQQIKLGLQVDPSDPLSFTYLTDNAAEGRSYGLEAEVDYQVIESLLLRTSGSLLDTEITSADNVIASLDGREQSHAPSWQYSAEAEYFFVDELSASLGVTGRDAFYFDDSHDQQSSPYHLLNASLRYYGEGWQLQLFARNITDKRYAVRGFFFGNEPPDFPEKEYVQLGDPFTFGALLSYRFG
ncbi:MAG: TonB-dependent receptor, partial [Bdellovibrionales bacterium]|nr:TonB-dependent receptor [Bdellovibrionales bacterium]